MSSGRLEQEFTKGTGNKFLHFNTETFENEAVDYIRGVISLRLAPKGQILRDPFDVLPLFSTFTRSCSLNSY